MMFQFCPSCGTKGSVQQQNATDYECTNCAWHFWNNAKAATAIAFVKDGKLLVVKRKRKPNEGKYELAGGFVDYGESAYDGAVREAREELGITLQPKDLELAEIYWNRYDAGISTVDITFITRTWQGKLTPNDDVAALEWKPFDFIYDPSFCQTYTNLDKIIQRRLSIT
jgi:ADP-ribose pyrophosphatase YjhB (NUDIX family)